MVVILVIGIVVIGIEVIINVLGIPMVAMVGMVEVIVNVLPSDTPEVID